MSSSNPPYPNFNGITYNSSFFPTTTSGGLTITTANKLYLQKTKADTATSLETFSGGISTSNIDSLTASTNMAIGTNIYNANILTLGTTGSKLVIPGPIDKVYCSSIDTFSNTNMYIGQFNATTLSLGSATCGTSTTGSLVVGTSLTIYGYVQVNGNSNITVANGTVFSPKIDATGSLTVGSNSSTTSLLLGSSTCPTTIQGDLKMGGSNNITLGNGTVAPTVLQLGYTIFGTRIGVFGDTLVSGTTKSLSSISITQTGTYLIYAQYTPTFFSGTPIVTILGQNVSSVLDTYLPNLLNYSLGGQNINVAYTQPICGQLSITSGTTLYLNWNSQFSGGIIRSGVNANIIFYATRIA